MKIDLKKLVAMVGAALVLTACTPGSEGEGEEGEESSEQREDDD